MEAAVTARFDKWGKPLRPSSWKPAHDMLARLDAAIAHDPKPVLASLRRQLAKGIDNADDGLLKMWLAEYRELIEGELRQHSRRKVA